MTGGWSAAACLALAALAVGWPRRLPGTRRRLLMRTGRTAPTIDLRAVAAHLRERLLRQPRRSAALAGLVAALVGLLLSGLVAAVAAAAYGALATRALLSRRAAGEERERRRRQLDDLCALAADLRAGLPGTGPFAESGSPPADRLAGLTRSAVRLAERTGAPLAELVERIEADARAADRGAAAAAAQAAGARATAGLLAVLPVGGIALGYTIGADPLHVLLHTPLGAACALGAVLLQLAGLAWTARLSSARAWAG
ncbi:type II secretion system F family protein [Micromonosporaceae bacterium DT55]|uniref:type II secretion system F family protein n=1 Tax=Melissospora conviva TaxID=3388432 RepID=UPI003C1F00C9